MPVVQLVILAAGHGRRFGGLKQLAPVGPNGESIMDYTALAAMACGFTGVVVVVRQEIEDEVASHVRRRWPAHLDVRYARQPPVPGTAQAVLCTRPLVDGPFGVANADDLYGEAALRLIVEHLDAHGGASGEMLDERCPADRHLLVAYQLARTVLSGATVTRGLCAVGSDHRLERIAEHKVHMHDDGTFDAVPLADAAPRALAGGERSRTQILLSGHELVSMNLWGFHTRLFGELDEAVAAFDPDTAERPELLLPDVVGRLVRSGQDDVHVVETANRCIGITHREDIAIVRSEVARESAHLDAVRARQA